MDELAKRRAENKGDSREWSVLDMLETMIADIKSGKTKPNQVAVHYFTNLPTGGYRHGYYVAGLTFQGHIALLHTGLDRVMKDWVE